MFVGHGVLAFVLLAWVARARGRTVEFALVVGLLAAGYGTLPDVDILYAPLGFLNGVGSVAGVSGAFWDAARSVHRSVTHSLIVGALATVVAAGWCAGRSVDRTARADGDGRMVTSTDGGTLSPTDERTATPPWRGGAGAAGRQTVGRRWRPLAHGGALAVTLGLIALAWSTAGPIHAAITSVLVAGALGLAEVARRNEVHWSWAALAAAVGLLTHPLGDLLTGAPPAMLYPLGIDLLERRLVLVADPTVNLLLAFFVELAVLWLGLVTVARLRGWRLRVHVRGRAAVGVGYAGALVAFPAPSIDAAAPFVVTVLAVGLSVGLSVGVSGRGQRGNRGRRLVSAVATGLTAVTVAGGAYLVAYLAVG
jgi:hypothetical protein